MSIETDLQALRDEVKAANTKASATLAWLRAHAIIVIPAALVLGWIIGRI